MILRTEGKICGFGESGIFGDTYILEVAPRRTPAMRTSRPSLDAVHCTCCTPGWQIIIPKNLGLDDASGLQSRMACVIHRTCPDSVKFGRALVELLRKWPMQGQTWRSSARSKIPEARDTGQSSVEIASQLSKPGDSCTKICEV